MVPMATRSKVIEIDVAALDQAIVADDMDMRGFGGVHHAAGFGGVVGKQDQGFDAGLDHVLHLLELEIVIALGVGGDDLGAELFGAALEGVQVGLPALAVHGFDGEADFQGVGCLGGRGLRADGEGENGGKGREYGYGLGHVKFLPVLRAECVVLNWPQFGVGATSMEGLDANASTLETA
jgi:hypothetical protein